MFVYLSSWGLVYIILNCTICLDEGAKTALEVENSSFMWQQKEDPENSRMEKPKEKKKMKKKSKGKVDKEDKENTSQDMVNPFQLKNVNLYVDKVIIQ